MSESSPKSDGSGRALFYSLIGLALEVVLAVGVVSGVAYPLFLPSGLPAAGCWVVPVAFVAVVFAFLGLANGLIALARLPAKQPSPARRKARTAVVLGCFLLLAMIAAVILVAVTGRGIT